VSLALLAACSDDGTRTSVRSTPAAASQDAWPMLAYGASSHFYNRGETLISPATVADLAPAWQFAAGGFIAGTPAVVEGRVYALATSGLHAFDAATGDVLWENRGVAGTSSPTYHEGSLYVNDGGAVLHRLDATTGEETWSATVDAHERASGFSSPVVAGDLVIVGSASTEEAVARDNATFRGSMVAFDRASGEEVWRHYTVDPPYNGVAIWSTPSVDEAAGVVLGTTGNNYTGEAGPTSDSIFALELATGELIWNRQLSEGDVFTIPSPRSPDSDFGTNAILFEAETDGRERKLLGAGQKSGVFWVLDRETGEVVWNRQVSPGSALIGGVFNNGAYDGERIIIAGNNGTSSAPGSEPANGASTPLGAAQTPTSVLMALDPRDGSVLWERQLPAWVWAPITLAGGVGFVSADNQLQAFDTATGEKLYTVETEGTIASGAAVAGGRVFFGSGIAYLGTTFDDTLHALALPE
jgi:polyvinyl alcohol dehydrogenase (cytochrome)